MWVIDYWRQVDLNTIAIKWFGWVTQNGRIEVKWDTHENCSVQETQLPSSLMDVGIKQCMVYNQMQMCQIWTSMRPRVCVHK